MKIHTRNRRLKGFLNRLKAITVAILVALVLKVVHWSIINWPPPGRIDPPVAAPVPNGYAYYLKACQDVANYTALDALGADSPDLSKAESVDRAYHNAIVDIDKGFRYPVVGPPARIYFVRSPDDPIAQLQQNEVHLFTFLFDDADLATRRRDWPTASTDWHRLMRFANTFPDLWLRYDYFQLKVLTREEAGSEYLTIIPHLDRRQTQSALDGINFERAAELSSQDTIRIEKRNTDQALLAMFHEWDWRGKWARGTNLDYFRSNPVGRAEEIDAMARLACESDVHLLNAYDDLETQAISHGRRPVETSDDPLLHAVGPDWPDAADNLILKGSSIEAASIDAALRLYHLDHGGYPASLLKLVPTYLPLVPAAPVRDGESAARFAYSPIRTNGPSRPINACVLDRWIWPSNQAPSIPHKERIFDLQ